MQRPVWLFSQDSEHFCAAPTTTGGLKSYYLRYGQKAAESDISLVHFLTREAIADWKQQWQEQQLPRAKAALQAGLQPIVGFSFYTWNAAEFLELMRFIKQGCNDMLVIAGGPHVQQAEDYLYDDPIDVIILGEGEQTFSEFLDASSRDSWPTIDGLAYLDAKGNLCKTRERERIKDLDIIPSALDVVPLVDDQGKALYDSISYETSRGCPYKCAFCEWGTGAIGGKMYQFSLDRIRRDWELIVNAGIKDIWLADSNFGALKEDLAKTEIICELKKSTGLPSTFATSWSKKHSSKVQQIALMLHNNGLLPHYQLALQTLTPLALELSNRKNMSANKYQPIAKQMAEEGVPIAAELIWGLPGDNLNDFETNLDTLIATFPNINIFGYTLLPGTEFYRKREQYQIKTIPVAGYGKAKGEYVIGCHTFDEEQGMEGYFLITAHIVLIHGYVMPLTTRYLALHGDIPASPLLRHVLRALLADFSEELSQASSAGNDVVTVNDRMSVYENRSRLYLEMLKDINRCYRVVQTALGEWLLAHQAERKLNDRCLAILEIDKAFCPRTGPAVEQAHRFTFNALAVRKRLEAMELPNPEDFNEAQYDVLLRHPGGVGEVLKDPDGGGWMISKIVSENTSEAAAPNSNTSYPEEQVVNIVG